jgi:enolase-phosphatase E1
MSDAAIKPRALLLDIEGTVTPISFVHDILFPFARNHVRDYLIQHSSTAEVQTDVAALDQERLADQQQGEQPPAVSDEAGSIDATVAYINRLIDCDRKSPALKSLQGKIWKQGYEDGALQAPLYDDVVPNLRRLRDEGLSISIFSSGSVLAQKLLFAHTQTGNHTDLIDQFFDTAVGSKIDPGSYGEIARRLELRAEQIVFISDVAKELQAAQKSRMGTLLCVRPGNPTQPASEQFQTVRNFSEILSE